MEQVDKQPLKLTYQHYLQNAPEHAVEALRGVALTMEDPEIGLEFLDKAHMCYPSNDRWQILIDTRLPEFLLDLLLDEKMYDFCGPADSDWNEVSIDEHKIRWTMHIVLYLSLCVSILRLRSENLDPESCRRCLEHLERKLPRLWELVWRRRRTILQEKRVQSVPWYDGDWSSPNDGHSRYEGVSNIRDAFANLLAAVYAESEPEPGVSLDSDHAKIIFYCWTHCSDLPPRHSYRAIGYLCPLILDPDPSATAVARRLSKFFRDTFAGVTDELILITETASYYLRHRDADERYCALLVMLLSFFLHARPELATKEALSDLYPSVVTAAYKQLCHERSIKRLNVKIYTDIVSLLQMMEEKDPELFRMNIYTTKRTLLPLLTRLWIMDIPGIDTPTHTGQSVVVLHYTCLYEAFMTKCEPDFTTRYGPAYQVAVDEAIRYTRRSWLSTLDELRARASSEESVPGFAEIWISRWIEHGHYFGLYEEGERARLERREDEERWQSRPSKPCGWAECLCALHKAPHPMTRCTGCMETYYCSKECQKKDWNEGKHRERCPGRHHSE